MSRVATAFKATAVLQLFDLVAIALSLVLVPLHLSRLGQEGYGLFLSGVTWASYLMFSSGGMSAATLILVSHAYGANDPDAISRIVRTSRALALLASGVVVVVALTAYTLLGVDAVAAATKLTHPEAAPLMLIVAAQVLVSLNGSPYSDLLVGALRPQAVATIHGTVRVATQLAMLGLLFVGATVSQVFAAGPVCAAAGVVATYLYARKHVPAAFTKGPYFERTQMAAQLRTGAKSLGLHMGSTLVGTAPILVLTWVGGPALVPLFAVPMRILGLANTLLTSFASVMQASFGDAWARRDLSWLRATTESLLRHTLMANVATVSLMLAVGPAFVDAWTGGKLKVSTLMVFGVAVAGSSMVFVNSLKQVLSGLNRHRLAAAAELGCGALSFLFCWAFTVWVSMDAIGLGVATAALLTSGVVMPRELRRYLESRRVGPGVMTYLALAAAGALCFGTAHVVLLATPALGLPLLASVFLSAGAAASVFAMTCQLSGVFDVLTALRRLRSRAGPAQPSA